ncbi:hypothetical protein [Hymenobacter sp. GOD-10R]|uniref:hypothetical protein n=1 Tax=Hymenobacter sp. GOD-10R TaxID=3093922 RepID=UPI002D770FE7|nr:hypothetical protein [Hymenobacter sp. GOD-10R]WRQ27744.1 hypothetical protein SD425_21975 [Hymenobacter sp. GOD-10R]
MFNLLWPDGGSRPVGIVERCAGTTRTRRSDALGVRPVVGCGRLHELGARRPFSRFVRAATGRTPRASDRRTATEREPETWFFLP